MACVGFVCDSTKVPLDKCLEMEYNLEGKCDLPYPLLALIAEQVSRSHAAISVTSCLYCLRRAYFQQKVDYYIRPQSALQAVYGTYLHKAIEDCSFNKWKKEIVVQVDIGGAKISGTIDALFESGGEWSLVDFKFPARAKREEYLSKYFVQVRTYVSMAREAGYNVTKAYLLVMPTSQEFESIVQYEVNLNPDLVLQDYGWIRGRALTLQKALEGNEPPEEVCTMRNFCPDEIIQACEAVNVECQINA